MSDAAEPDDVRRERGTWLVVIGLLTVVLGAMGFWMLPGLTLAGLNLYGGMFALLGGMLILSALFGLIMERRWLKLALGIVYLTAGLLIAFNPLGVGAALTFVIGASLVMVGAMRALWISRFSREHNIWGVAGGAVSVLLGVLIVLWPSIASWALGLFIAVDLVFYGLTVGMCGWSLRKPPAPN